MQEQETTVVESTVTTYYNIEMQYDEILPTPDFDPEAVGQVRPKLIEANLYIAKLNNLIGEKHTELNEERSRRYELKGKVEEFLTENIEDLGRELVKELADIFDIELKKTIKFTATIEVEGELEVDLWTDSDDYFDDIEFNVDLSYYSDGTVTSTDVTEITER